MSSTARWRYRLVGPERERERVLKERGRECVLEERDRERERESVYVCGWVCMRERKIT